MEQLEYQPLEYVPVTRPVDRIRYIIRNAHGKKVLDLGCWDETALVKRGSQFWLHEEIAKNAIHTIGIDNSSTLPDEGVILDRSRIIKGDITQSSVLTGFDIELIVAGEIIEHLPDTLQFLKTLKASYSGKRLILSTPNATNFSNALMSLFKRESSHCDHLQIYSYKTLNTLCKRAGFKQYQIIPYHVRYTEMILRQTGLKKLLLQTIERFVNSFEFLFPLLSGGFIVDAQM